MLLPFDMVQVSDQVPPLVGFCGRNTLVIPRTTWRNYISDLDWDSLWDWKMLLGRGGMDGYSKSDLLITNVIMSLLYCDGLYWQIFVELLLSL